MGWLVLGLELMVKIKIQCAVVPKKQRQAHTHLKIGTSKSKPHQRKVNKMYQKSRQTTKVIQQSRKRSMPSMVAMMSR